MLIHKFIATCLFATATCLNFIIWNRDPPRVSHPAQERKHELQDMKQELDDVWVGQKIGDDFDQIIDDMVLEPEVAHRNVFMNCAQ